MAEYYRQVGKNSQLYNILQSVMRTPKLAPTVMFQVAAAYNRAQMYPQMDQVLRKCMRTMPPSTPPQAFLNIAAMYSRSGNGTGMRDSLKLYLKRQPKDWKAWLDLATIQMQLNNIGGAREAVGNALHYGGPQARQTIQSNPALNRLIRPVAGQQNLMKILNSTRR